MGLFYGPDGTRNRHRRRRVVNHPLEAIEHHARAVYWRRVRELAAWGLVALLGLVLIFT